MARMKDIVIKLQNGEELTADEMAVVVESGVDMSSYTRFDKSKISNIKFDGIDYKDTPRFCDAFISSADYNGNPMTSEQLDEINEDRDFVYSELMSYLY